jgi:hypothetical protein
MRSVPLWFLFICGLLVMLIGAFRLLAIYAFAGIHHPSVQGWDRFKSTLSKIWSEPDGLVFGSLHILLGLVACIIAIREITRTQR